MNYIYVVKKRGDIKRGAWTVAKATSEMFPDSISVLDISKTTNINDHRTQNTILIFPYQSMRMYEGVYSVTKQHKTDIVYTRTENMNGLYNPCTNGFSYWKESPIKRFIPHLITIESTEAPDKVVIGYYNRPVLTSQSYFAFIDFLNENKYKISKVVLMGVDNSIELAKRLNIKVEHTFDREKFFNSISHYYYFKSNDFIDPYPHSLEEAVKAKKQIIIYQNDRAFKDGIDDIETTIKYHTTLTAKIYDNSNSILCSDVMERYYKKLLGNNFEYNLDKTTYKTFDDWLSSI